MIFNRLFQRLGMTALLTVMAVSVNAADSSSADQWQFGAELYAWGASIYTTPTGGDEVHISLSDIIDNLDMALMTTFGARKDKWSLLTDIIYLNLQSDESGSADLIGTPIKTDVDVELKAWIVTTAGGYTVLETDKHSLDLLAGARYLWLDLDLDFDLGPISQTARPSGHILDGIIGVRGKLDLADKWYLSYYLDAGAGDSDMTWQGMAVMNYKFEKVDAAFGYRYLDWNFDDGDLEDLTVKGPFAGVKFKF